MPDAETRLETGAGAETGLPPEAYLDPDVFARERDVILLPSWQIVCHESDIPDPGDYASFDFLGALILVVRGADGRARAFRNVCRHRGARIADADFGNCGKRLVCPYHAWSYDLAGRLIGAPERASYAGLDPESLGLDALELGECGGFLFVRPAPGGEAFDAFAAPLRELFETYRTREMRALGRVTLRERAVNWKVATDNYVDVLHLPVAHKGLNELLGDSYTLTDENGVCRIESQIQDGPFRFASNRAYAAILPKADHLPAALKRAWIYLKLWPNLAFDLYPDQIDFMQFIPTGPRSVTLREIPYALPGAGREMRAARYLNWRINRVVNREDAGLLERVQAGIETPGYRPGPLSAAEAGVRGFAGRWRGVMG